MTDSLPIFLDDYRPHRFGNVRCSCGREWVAVAPAECRSLACPDCGAMNEWGDQ